jgi:hypothetical protein
MSPAFVFVSVQRVLVKERHFALSKRVISDVPQMSDHFFLPRVSTKLKIIPKLKPVFGYQMNYRLTTEL